MVKRHFLKISKTLENVYSINTFNLNSRYETFKCFSHFKLKLKIFRILENVSSKNIFHVITNTLDLEIFFNLLHLKIIYLFLYETWEKPRLVANQRLNMTT